MWTWQLSVRDRKLTQEISEVSQQYFWAVLHLWGEKKIKKHFPYTCPASWCQIIVPQRGTNGHSGAEVSQGVELRGTWLFHPGCVCCLILLMVIITSLFCIALIYWHFSSFACWRPSKISAEFNVLCIMWLNSQRKNNHCLSASPFLTKICDRCLLLEHQIWSCLLQSQSPPPKQCVKSHRSVMIHRSIYLLQSDF